MTVEAIFSDCLAYAQQGLILVGEGNRDAAKFMFQLATELMLSVHEKSKLSNNKLFNDARFVLSQLEQKLEGNEEIEVDFSHTVDAKLVYWIPEGVQLVSIEKGSTKHLHEPTFLAILSVEEPEKAKEISEHEHNLHGILQVGSWAYPLIQSKTHIMMNEMGVFVVPNPTKNNQDLHIGILLPRNINQQQEADFINVLQQYATVKSNDIVKEMSTSRKKLISQRLSEFFRKTAERFTTEINEAVGEAQEKLTKKGEVLRAHLKESEEPVNVSPVIKHGVLVGCKGSEKFAKLTKAMLDKVSKIGNNLGERIINEEKPQKKFVNETATIVSSGLTSFGMAKMSLEEASRQLFMSFADETVKTIKVKYGEEASETSYDVLRGIGLTTFSAMQLADLGDGLIAATFARSAGIQVVEDLAGTPNQPKPKMEAKIETRHILV